jgi:hypothetical protein
MQLSVIVLLLLPLAMQLAWSGNVVTPSGPQPLPHEMYAHTPLVFCHIGTHTATQAVVQFSIGKTLPSTKTFIWATLFESEAATVNINRCDEVGLIGECETETIGGVVSGV